MNSTFDDTISIQDLDFSREFSIAGVGTFFTLLLALALVVIHIKFPKLGFSISVGYVVICSALTTYMSVVFNKNWSLIWMYSFLIAVFFELLLSQSLLMIVVAILYKQQIMVI